MGSGGTRPVEPIGTLLKHWDVQRPSPEPCLTSWLNQGDELPLRYVLLLQDRINSMDKIVFIADDRTFHPQHLQCRFTAPLPESRAGFTLQFISISSAAALSTALKSFLKPERCFLKCSEHLRVKSYLRPRGRHMVNH